MGRPSTADVEKPRNTKVMARPRRSGGTSRPAQAAACGVKTAGASMASMRTPVSEPRLGMAAHTSCSTPYQAMANVSRRRRSQPATSEAITGAETATTTADAVMTCPVLARDTFSEALISGSVPGTTDTP